MSLLAHVRPRGEGVSPHTLIAVVTPRKQSAIYNPQICLSAAHSCLFKHDIATVIVASQGSQLRSLPYGVWFTVQEFTLPAYVRVLSDFAWCQSFDDPIQNERLELLLEIAGFASVVASLKRRLWKNSTLRY